MINYKQILVLYLGKYGKQKHNICKSRYTVKQTILLLHHSTAAVLLAVFIYLSLPINEYAECLYMLLVTHSSDPLYLVSCFVHDSLVSLTSLREASLLSDSLGELLPAVRLLSRLPSRPLPPPVLLRDFVGDTLLQRKSSATSHPEKHYFSHISKISLIF